MIIDTQLGQLEVNTSNNRISSIQFIDEPNAVQDEQDNPVRNQLIQFLNRERQDFTLDIQLKGTEFQLKVWNEILKVPYGETRSYKQIAQAIGSPGATRAVGTACKLNPIPIIVPCHRVIHADGTIGNYAGGPKLKHELLNLEKPRRRLNQDDYAQDALQLAQTLIGKILCKRLKSGLVIRQRIAETEAYLGEADTACHASNGKTPRNAPMYESGGITYVYLCYGIHSMLNIVSGPKDNPEAVLIRGSLDTRGPGKLTKQMEIDTSHNRIDLITSHELWLEDDNTSLPFISTPRIGIQYASPKDQAAPWRFVVP